MKKTVVVIMVGVAALHIVVFSGMIVGGCKNEVMGERRYQDPYGGEGGQVSSAQSLQPMTGDQVQTAETPAAVSTQQQTPAAQQQQQQPAPSYQPMTDVHSSGGVTSAAPVRKGGKGGKTATATAAAGGTYVVKSGDTIGKIANAHGVSASAVLKANNMDQAAARKIQIGQKLTIPAASAPVVRGAKDVTATAGGTATAQPAATGELGPDGLYVVKSGDQLGKIARKFKVKVADIQKANNLTDTQLLQLQIGQKLVIPGKSPNTAVPAKSQPAAAKPAPTAKTPATVPATPATSDISTLIDSAESTPVTPAATTPAAPAANDFHMVTEDSITVKDFAAKYGVSVADILSNNSDLKEDSTLIKDRLIFLPKK